VSVEMEKAKKNHDSRSVPLSSDGQQIQHILEALPFYVLLIDSAHNIVAVNQKAVQDFKLSSEKLIGAYCPIAVHGQSFPIAECPLVEASEKGESVEREFFDSGNVRWTRASVFPTALITEDGNPVYLHFARDITDVKNTERKLSESLEHHSALCDLLQRFQHCQAASQILEAFIDEIISLSWLGMSTTAVGFLAKENHLELVVQRNLLPGQLALCRRVKFGECLCGKAAETGSGFECSSSCSEHTFQYEGMGEHRHAVLPISHEGRVLGIVTLYLKSGDKLSAFQRDFLDAAVSAAAAALAGQLAREEVKRIRENAMARMIWCQENERKHIAKELHDQVCQSLSALLIEMQAHSVVHESIREIQRGCEDRVRGIIDEVRKMAGQLRPTILDDFGLEKALARRIEELSSKTGLPIDYQCESCPESEQRLPVPVEIGLYRIALEALDNIISHSSARRASVIILRKNAKVTLLVEDDGCGFDCSTVRKDLSGCLGLIEMEERAGLMGGTLRIESAPQKGTTVRVEIHLDSPPAGSFTACC
jgi:PAS domain S-box-containing protein